MQKAARSVLFIALALIGCEEQAELVEGDDLVVLHGATLLDGTGASALQDAVVILEGERISRVGTAGQFRFPNDATVIDLEGRWLLPGFIDTHVHSRALDQMGSTLLGFGITTIRSPGDRNGVEMRERIESGDFLGPTLLSGGRIIDHVENRLGGGAVKLETEAQVRDEVRRQVAAGVDQVKVYMGLPPALVEAAVDEGHRRGVRVLGHLHRTSWTEAAEAGIDGLMHSGSEGPSWELLDEGARGRFPWEDFGGYLRAWASSADEVDLGGAKMDRLLRALVENRVEVNPTLVIMESLYWGDDPSASARLDPSFATPEFRDVWWGENWEEGNPFMRRWALSDDEWRQVKQGFDSAMDMVRTLHDNGVLITAGSDVGMPWITPGVSFHRELELLVESGISPSDVLTIATRNGAVALGLEDRVGTIEPGKEADLLILRRDPTDDIHNTREIEWVIVDGVQYEARSLRR